MTPPDASPSARIERASHCDTAPVEHMGVYPGRGHVAVAQQLLHRADRNAPGSYDRGHLSEDIQVFAYQGREARITDTIRVLLGRDRRELACRGGVLRLEGPGRVPPVVPIQCSGPLGVNDALQSLYSIDRLPELPGHQRGFPAQCGQVIGNVLRFESGQPPTRKGPDELLGPQRVPAHRCWYNPLRKKKLPVAIPEMPFPVGATPCRHKATSLHVRNAVRAYVAATGDTEARGKGCYTESVYHQYCRFCLIYC
jgi:hypothetical protein